MKQNIVYAELVLQVGSLCFMECKSNTLLFGKSTYYWKFKDYQTYYGPFNDLMECGLNVDAMMRMPPDQQMTQASGTVATVDTKDETVMNNVIKVDFKTKRRLK